jgi:hypothetical protein
VAATSDRDEQVDRICDYTEQLLDQLVARREISPETRAHRDDECVCHDWLFTFLRDVDESAWHALIYVWAKTVDAHLAGKRRRRDRTV